MFLDKENLFDNAAAITVTRNSTNVIDLTKAGQDIGVGEPLHIAVAVVETFTAGGAATLQIAVVTDDNAALATPTILRDFPDVFALAELAKGRETLIITLGPTELMATMERYLGLVYTVATGPMTAGKVTAGIVKDYQRNKPYPKNYVTA